MVSLFIKFNIFLFFFMGVIGEVFAACNNPPAYVAKHGLSSQAYQNEFNRLTRRGYRLTDVSAYSRGNTVRFAAIWEKKSGPAWVARHGMSSSQYQAEFNKWTSRGYRLTDISGYSVGNQVRYAAIFEKRGGGAWVARHGMTSGQYQAEFNKRTKQGYRLTQVAGYGVGNKIFYAAIFEKRGGGAWVARHGMSSNQYQREFNTRTRQGYRLTHVSGYSSSRGEARYAAIFEKARGPAWTARHGLMSANYQSAFLNNHYQGYQLKQVSGYYERGVAKFAAIWSNFGSSTNTLNLINSRIENYIKNNNIPGAGVAITKNGCLVFAKGYGYADKDKKLSANPLNLFRIASVSKPITSIAIMRLVQSGAISLNSKVFGPNTILGNKYGTPPYSQGIRNITVAHLLRHTSGWSNSGGDPMFMGFNNHSDIIDFMIDNRGLANSPGSNYEYLNFGYSVLGRIIEEVSGKSYEAFVRSQVLNKSGIQNMRIGASSKAGKQPWEVIYYPSSAYNLSPFIMDAHGGWIASPIDLVKLMAKVEGVSSAPSLLNNSVLNQMYQGSAANSGYGSGWILSGNDVGHNGAMPGTGGFLWRKSNGFSWAILLNTRPSNDNFINKANGVMADIVNDVSQWPSYDLF